MQSKTTIDMYKHHLSKYGGLDYTHPHELLETLLITKKKYGDKSLSLAYVKNIICAIVWKIRQENQKSPLLREYQYIISNLRGKLERRERDHKNVEGKLPKWEMITKKREEEYKAGNLKNHLILSLYSYIPPRRIKDYILLKVVQTPQQTKNEEFNYYVTSKKLLIFNAYKTAKTFKQQTETVPDELHKIIMNYIKINKIKNGDLLLGFTNYLQLNYLLKKLLGCGIDNLRHSYINHSYEHFNIPTNEYMENLAAKMSHSLTTHLRYRKF